VKTTVKVTLKSLNTDLIHDLVKSSIWGLLQEWNQLRGKLVFKSQILLVAAIKKRTGMEIRKTTDY